ncbi:hypothetical protein [Streptomyces sp. NBC_01171]|uniref:hypothetical protein n=1 Tax=Streptomyces sp. NBC_01171 TaxID=2903757 RepID=UPI00386A66F6|nr:hypothetical protein OG448_09500 [Streptomyces sp. NBC_01171]
MRGPWRAAAAVTLAALAALTTACGHDKAATPSSTPSGYADMKKKVDAAESAAAAADRDARSDADR